MSVHIHPLGTPCDLAVEIWLAKRLRVNKCGAFWKAALVGMALTACACAPLPRIEHSSGARKASSYEATASFRAPDKDWPIDGWWRAYGDEQLSALIDAALIESPSLAQAQARIREAVATVSEAQSTSWPSLNLDGTGGKIEESRNQGFPAQIADLLPRGYHSTASVELKLQYEFDFWGKNRAAIAAAVSDARAVQADAAEARLALSTGIALAYADLGRLYAEYDVEARTVEVRLETLNLVARRVENGLDTRAELKQAEAGAPAARAQIAGLEENIAQTRNRIAAMIGAGPDRGLAIARPAATTIKSFGLPSNVAANLLGRRPDLAAARWRAEAAAKRVGVARAQFYPNINLAAYIGQQALFASLLWRASSRIGAAQPAISLPIFEGGRLRAQLRSADAEYNEATSTYESTLVQALLEVADAAASARALDTRLEQSRIALAASEEAYSITRLRYSGGLSNYQSVLIAEDAVLQARLLVADLEARAFTIDVQLVQALGGGYTQT